MDCTGEFLRHTPHFKGKSRLIRRWLHNRNKTDTRIRLLPGGARILCDFAVPYEAMVWLRQEEQADLRSLHHRLCPGDIFIDCGANIGLWSLVASTIVGDKGQVFAFEPNPTTVAKAQHNLEMSQRKNVTLTCVALSNANRKVAFQLHQEHNNSSVVTDLTETSAGTIEVDMVRLDSFWEQNEALKGQPIAGMKIDVEGHELQVLEGAQDILRNYRPWLCIEFNALLSPSPRLGDWDVHKFLSKFNYRARPFVDTSKRNEWLSDDWQQTGYSNLLYLCDAK